MLIKILDTKGFNIQLECNSTDKLSSLLSKFEEKYKEKNPKAQIRTITFSYNGEMYSNEDYDKSLEELDIEDGCLISSSIYYNGGLI